MKIEIDYFNWLCEDIADEDFDPSRYQLLLGKLYHTSFRWTIPNDKNRAADGEALRLRYAEETNQNPMTIKMSLGFPCSILEMMIALAERCETQIMEDLFVGPRIGRWFKQMLHSLGILYENDELYDEKYVEYILDSFLDRTYEENGDGGLFMIENPPENMREIEIWYQMNFYLRGLEAG